MISLIPVVGAVVAKILCWPINQVLALPADQAVSVVKAACNWAIGGC